MSDRFDSLRQELDLAWMRLACSSAAAARPAGDPDARGAALAPARRSAEARRRRHPAVVARLRAAQRFGQRELKGVPHA